VRLLVEPGADVNALALTSEHRSLFDRLLGRLGRMTPRRAAPNAGHAEVADFLGWATLTPVPVGYRAAHLKCVPASPSGHNPSLDEGFSAVVLELLSKLRRARYPSAWDSLADFERCLRGETPEALETHSGGEAAVHSAARSTFCEPCLETRR